ncbi:MULTISPECIES: hypothetical protein [Bifidobacterium]|uniref:Uncharacterized protein n=1 Tax=Bifidobacterium myosotis TaxID=1630166 RepID=A0A261FD88_9BIFI|nr:MULTISPECIES: hypothetical protein [Bifidobacterium]OZG57102.1 hypothetical protein BMYO_2085 [Bifidobacterium myosotis]
MSFKDSMIRGLAMYGVSSMAQAGMTNAKVMRDIINDVEKNAR